MKAIAVSSGIARSPSTLPEARQMERGTRMTGSGKGCSAKNLTDPEASPLVAALQAEVVGLD